MWKKREKPRRYALFFDKKYPQARGMDFAPPPVDSVDKSAGKEIFADIYHISGSHSYQQITVDTIF